MDLEQNATYTPPSLPTHVTVRLEPVLGTPSDEEVVRVQEAVRAYQHFSSGKHQGAIILNWLRVDLNSAVDV